jgi:putative FmdB family regulatory protein
MLVYDFDCKECSHQFEAFVRTNADTKIPCPQCGSAQTLRLTSGGNFSLPGSDTGFPTAADKWARRHRKANAHNLKDLGIPTD